MLFPYLILTSPDTSTCTGADAAEELLYTIVFINIILNVLAFLINFILSLVSNPKALNAYKFFIMLSVLMITIMWGGTFIL